MASRSKSSRRRESDTDSLEALKPLVVLGLLGMILYGAYSIVQKGPAAPPAALPEAPAFSAQPAAPAVAAGTPATPHVELPPAPAVSLAPAVPAAPPLPSVPSPPVATTPQLTPAPASTVAPPAEPPATVSQPSTPTYLSAQSAPPPELADVPLPEASAPGLTTAAPSSPTDPTATPASADVTPAAQREPARLPSAAFAAAWADAHEKLSTARYAEALAVLSAWYDDASLGVEESQRLEDLLGQLAGTVIYSQQDLLLPPHIVAPGDTLVAIAENHGVPWQLLAKINGIDEPSRLIPGEAIKMVRGPFDAVVSVSRRRLSLQVGGNYAGAFPVVVGRRVQERIGASLAVAEIHRDGAGSPGGQPTSSSSFVQQVAGHEGMKSIVLSDGMRIEAADDPIALADTAPEGSLIVSSRDLDELIDILGPGSHVLIRN